MDKGFDRVDTDVRELRSEMNTRFDSMQQQTRTAIRSRSTASRSWPACNSRWSRMQRTMTTMLASLLDRLLVVIVGFAGHESARHYVTEISRVAQSARKPPEYARR